MYKLSKKVLKPSAKKLIFTTEIANYHSELDASTAKKKLASVLGISIISMLTTPYAYSHGIEEIVTDGSPIVIDSNSPLIQTGNSNSGIYASESNTGGPNGSITITHQNGQISTNGSNSYGIFASQSANLLGVGDITINVKNTGSISTLGSNSTGIWAQTSGGNVTINNDASINIRGTAIQSRGIRIFDNSDTANVLSVNNTGTITHDIAGTTQHYGIEVYVKNNSDVTVNHSGNITGSEYGIVVWSSGAVNTGSQGIINITGNGSVYSVNALTMDLSDRNTMNIAQGAVVNAKQYTLSFRTNGSVRPINTINNSGLVISDRDTIIYTRLSTPGTLLNINNNSTGIITGVISTQNSNVTMLNNGIWNLRNFADTTGNQIRDRKSVAISNFGNGNITIINNGTLNLAAVNAEQTTNTAGQYVPVGALGINNTGIVQGQLLNVNRFENAGVIDLSINNQPGDVLVISGNNVAGIYNASVANQYISNGGGLKLNTLLNTGGIDSLSDILVLDDVVMGSGATKIYITPVANSPGGPTTGDGIKLVEILGTAPQGSFTLGRPITYGAYEYVLAQGSGTDEKNWYLQNFERVIPPALIPDPDDKETGKVWLINPNAGAYHTNQYVAATLFNQNILDRRNSVRSSDQTLWIRTQYSDSSTHLLGGKQQADIQTGLVQIGADLFKKGHMVASLYTGYGHSRIDNTSRQTGTSTNGQVEGYQIGTYLSWLPEENKGFYADFWTHYAWYRNKLSGMAHLSETKYNSTGYALSAEVGYGFILGQQDNENRWILEPHAQVIYTHLNADNFHDSTGTWHSNNKGNGWQSRLGARLYGQKADEDKSITPFVELNWLHNNLDNEIRLNGISLESRVGRDIAELKFGIQGELTPGLHLWGHMGLQGGAQHYRKHEIQVGLSWLW